MDMRKALKAVASVVGMLAAYLLLQILLLMLQGALYAVVLGIGEFIRTGGVENMPLLVDYGVDFITAYSAETIGVSNLLSLGIFYLHYRNRREENLLEIIRVSPLPKTEILPISLFAIGMAFFVSFGLPLLPFSETLTEAYTESSGSLIEGGVLAFLSNVLVAPLFEEVLFRGMIYNRLKEAFPGIPAALFSALIFGLLHGELIWILYAFFVGLILTLIYEKYDSLLANVLFHVVFNLIGGYVTTGIWVEGIGYLLLLVAAAALFILFLIRTMKRPRADREE